jgi:hypothetical protein
MIIGSFILSAKPRSGKYIVFFQQGAAKLAGSGFRLNPASSIWWNLEVNC